MVRLEPKVRSGAAEALKKAALRLFAERGVDGVTVREIADAAGQKNHGAVGYHFGSKEALVRELVVDGAILIDERRNQGLDAMESAGGPHTVREVIELIIYSSIDIAGGPVSDESYVRFVVMLSMTHRDFFYAALENRWNSGYQRCLKHLRGLLPPMPRAAQNQRFLFLAGAIRAIMAMRESALSDATRPHPMWSSPETLQHCADVLTAMMETPYRRAPDAEAKAFDNASALTNPLGPVPPPSRKASQAS